MDKSIDIAEYGPLQALKPRHLSSTFRRALDIGILASTFVTTQCFATTWFFYDSDGTVGANVPNSTAGPYRWEYMSPGPAQHDESVKFANATPRSGGGTYTEISTFSAAYGSQHDYYFQISNPNGNFGTAFSETNPIQLVNGRTYYLAGFFRYQRVNGVDVFHDTNGPNSYSKLFEIDGSTRWLITSGWGGVHSGSFDHKFTFDLYSSPGGCTNCGFNEKWANVAPYNQSNPYLCDYEKWYAVVMGFTPNTGANGKVELWINGTKTTSLTQKVADSFPVTIARLQGGGTTAQPAYDAPQHKMQMDGLTFTDELSTLQSKGYFSDPNQSTSPTSPPGAPVLQTPVVR